MKKININWYEKIKQYYELGFWDLEMTKKAVRRKKITREQFKNITGEDYKE